MNPPAGWHPDPYDPALDRYWDGHQWTGHTHPRGSDARSQVFAAAGTTIPSNNGTKRRSWPWLLGVVALGVGFVIVAAVAGQDQLADSAPVVATVTSSAAPTTTTRTTAPASTSQTPSTTTSPAPAPREPEVAEITTEVAEVTTEGHVPTTQAAPVPPAPTRSLEYSCSDADWREAMGSDGDALCGSTSRPRNQSQPTTQYTPPVATREQSSTGTVHPGSYCSTPGATGVTTKGTPMVCAPGSDGEDRWRLAN